MQQRLLEFNCLAELSLQRLLSAVFYSCPCSGLLTAQAVNFHRDWGKGLLLTD